MTARFHHELRFYADATSLGLAEGLECFRRDLVYPGHRLVYELQQEMQDEEWIPIVGRLGLVVITRDGRLRTKPRQWPLLVAHRVRVVHLDFKKDTGNWDALVLLVKSWEAIEEFIAAHSEGPWWLAVGLAGIRTKPFGHGAHRYEGPQAG